MADLTLRLPDELHRVARIAAATRGQSLQAWIREAIHAAVLQQAKRRDGEPVRAALDG